MEFYSIADVSMSVGDIQRHIVVANLHEWCESIVQTHDDHSNKGKISCLSGDFIVHRELLSEGLRFSMPSGPHALQWTITTLGKGGVLVHCTINARQAEAGLLGKLEHFVANWRAGLEDWPIRLAARPGQPCFDCGESYGGFG